MGRPTKKGVDYFSHDTQISGKTIFTLEQLFGNDGYAFWFKLLEILGQQEGLYYDCSATANWLFLTAKTRVSSERAKEIIQCLVDLEAIEKTLWQEKQIIWCEKFVERVKDVFVKRQVEIPQKPSFCNGNNTPSYVSVAESAQSKIKESKVKESKRDESIYKTHTSAKNTPKHKYGEFKHILLTDNEFNKLVEDYGNIKALDAINYVDRYLEKTGKSYKNHYLVIRDWGYEGSQKEKSKKSDIPSGDKMLDALFANLELNQ